MENRSSVVQFGLRSLFAAASIACALAAALGPVIRDMPADVRRRLFWMAPLQSGVVLVSFAVLCLRRWQAENHGGKILLRTNTPGKFSTVWPAILMLIIFAGILVGLCRYALPSFVKLADIMQGTPQGEWWLPIGSVALLAPNVIGVVYAVSLLWWRISPLTMEIREAGVLLGAVTFLPWHVIQRYEWNVTDRAAVLRLSIQGGEKSIPLCRSQQNSIDEILQSLLRTNAKPD